MSYGTLSGEAYVSDLSLAFLEDTGHYLANYTAAGRIGNPSTEEFVDLAQSIFSSSKRPARQEELEDVKERGPGYLRFGREEGCSFFENRTRTWPVKYLCSTNGAGKCSADNRMSSFCRLYTYGEQFPVRANSEKKITCTRGVAAGSSNPPPATCGSVGNTDSYPSLPETYKFFAGAKEAFGGWNSAMDCENLTSLYAYTRNVSNSDRAFLSLSLSLSTFCGRCPCGLWYLELC